ncbi:MAG: endolytic transglycosylase MltG, partial [Epsilonproteobacteria bacterium]|nr:endolytic transglycosylase MltG [Campylobacterota bacterium]
LSLKYKKKYSPKEFEKYLIIASIIQKETHHKEEMPLIAAVIYNRLNRDIPLQIDATLNYGKYSHTPVTPYRIRNDKSKYNTYYHKGLPPKPLCSVSIDALKAALNPPKLGYLYFVRTINGYHRFSISYKDHLANITLYKVEKAKLRKYKSFLKGKKK